MTEKESENTATVIIEPITSPLPRIRIRLGLIATVGGMLFFLVGAQPGIFGLDRSPVVGFIQIAVMLVGLAVICIGGYVTVRSLWRKTELSIAADIGMRLISTGYVVALFSGMADVFGIGSHPLSGVPFFGVWQARGMEIGSALVAIGFIMMFPYNKQFEKGT